MIYRHVFKEREFLHAPDKPSLRTARDTINWLIENISPPHWNVALFSNTTEMDVWHRMKSEFIDMRCNIDCGFGQFHMLWKAQSLDWTFFFAEFYSSTPSEIVIEADDLILVQAKLAVLSA